MSIATVTVETSIAAPRETVYEFFVKRESINTQLPLHFTLIRPGAVERSGVGAQYHLGRGKLGPVEETTALVPGERMEYKVVSGLPVKRHVGTITFADTPTGGTRVTYRMEAEASIPLPTVIAELALRAATTTFLRAANKALKTASH